MKGRKVMFPNLVPNHPKTTSHDTTDHGNAKYRGMACQTILDHVRYPIEWKHQKVLQTPCHGMEWNETNKTNIIELKLNIN